MIPYDPIYKPIWQDKRYGGSLYKHLRQRGKKRNKRGAATSPIGPIPHRIGIEQRPAIVNFKQRVGDLEIDTIVEAGHKGAILSIIERKTKLTILSLLSRNNAETVCVAMIS